MPTKKEGPARDLHLEIYSGIQTASTEGLADKGHLKEKTKTNRLGWKRKGVREETETKVLILSYQALNNLVKGLSYPPQWTFFQGRCWTN